MFFAGIDGAWGSPVPQGSLLKPWEGSKSHSFSLGTSKSVFKL